MGAPTVNVDHAKMAAVVTRLDALIDDLDSKGVSGSYAGLQDAAMLAEAVCSVNQKEMGEFVDQYNVGFGAAAGDYRDLCQLLVQIRNAVAKTANIHLANDDVQAGAFAPLQADSWKKASGHDNPADGHSGSAHPTTVEAPGQFGPTTQHSSGTTTNDV